MAEPKPSLLLPVLLIVVVLVVAGVGGVFLYEKNHPKSAAGPWTVAIGSNVTVNYVGTLGSGAQAGRVFDTSIYSIATNNLSYPKALGFTFRGSAANYTPLPVAVGPNIPSSGYTIANLTFGGVVTGFWQGLIGLSVGQTRSVAIPPSLAYGPPNPSCFVTRPLTLGTPVLVTVAASDFGTYYPGVNATVGTHFADPTYGWTDLILSVNATAVVVENLPTVGWTVPGISWPQVVSAVNTTTITITNQLTSANTGTVGGSARTGGVCGATKFIVSGVNSTAGTYIEDFNAQVVGQTLDFTVTIVAKY